MTRVLKVAWMLAATVAAAACTDYESATDLNTEGPPMIQQVRLRETYTLAGGTATSQRTVFGFGTHPNVIDPASEAHPVTSATASANRLRIIVDELLVGNYLEEVACRAQVDTDAYAAVPLGATPDNIRECSGPQDTLPSTCRGRFATCICELDQGCLVNTTMVARGAPVGILDINQDGAADDTRFIQGAVGLQCGSIDVPIDLDMSYWNPSGNQQVPAQGGFDALGPAIVVTPTRGLPTNLDCNITVAETIVDKAGERLCAPLGGDIEAGCTPGDVSQFGFSVEALSFESSSFDNNATGVSRTGQILFLANTALDAASIQGATLVNAMTNAPVAGITIDQAMTPPMRTIRITPPMAGLAPNTQYRVTIPTSVRDSFAQPLPQPFVVTFTTGA